jgi:hypothetical protein
MRFTIRRRARIAAMLLALLAPVACVKRENEPLGGNWYIVWEISQIPEAGGTHPHLYRKRFPFGGRRVEENTWRYRYLGDDCVLYVAGNSNRGDLRAACGDRAPVVIADHMDDRTQGYVRDRGIAGDPVSINGGLMTVREIKARAGHEI